MTNANLADWLHSWRGSLRCEAPCEAAVCLCNERVEQIIAALRRSEPVCERCKGKGGLADWQGNWRPCPICQPESDKVLVPREPTEAILKAGESCYLAHQQEFATKFWLRSLIEKLYSRLLTAAEAEGRHE